MGLVGKTTLVRVLLWGAVCLLWSLSACTAPPDSGPGKRLCTNTEECPTGFVCYLNFCHWKESLPTYNTRSEPAKEPLPEPAKEPLLEPDGEPVIDSDASVQEKDEPVQERSCKEGQPDCNKPCGSRDDCPEGLLCRDQRCVPCKDNNDCGDPLERCLKQRCVRGGCVSNVDCQGGKVCVQSQCQVCNDDKQCDPGQLCLSGLCLEAQCRSRKDCKDGKVCLQSQCRPCIDKTDCENDEVCVVGVCKQGNCVQNSDCQGGQACVSNQCAPCTLSAQCNTDEVCEKGTCKKGNCVVASDCKGGQVCETNQCTPCNDTPACGSDKVCVSGVCSSGNCVSAGDCTGGQICVSNQCTPCNDNSQCAGGEVCDKGACKKGNCVQKSDCKGGEICVSNQCSPCKTDADCDARLFQQCVSGRCSTPAIQLKGVYRWADGTLASDCAGYRYPPPGYQSATSNGVYLLKKASGGSFSTFCAQEFVGGGWTLVMKVDGSKNTFRYSSAQWTSKKPLNPTALQIDTTEAKFESYGETPVEEILLVFVSNNGKGRTVIARKSGTSLYDLMQDGKPKSFDVAPGRLAWKSLVPGGSLQFHCDREGLNIASSIPKNGSVFNLRIGIFGNNEQDCTTPDSFIGVGANEVKNVANTGNYAVYSTDEGDRNTRSFAYIYVRKLTSTLGTKDDKGAKMRADGKVEPSCLGYRTPPVASTSDGVYWIQPKGVSAPFQAYCDMKTDGGGWTLAMKADGRKTTFRYDQAIWTNGKTLNDKDVLLDTKEAKLQPFLSLPVQHVLLKLQTPPGTGTTRHVKLSRRATNAQSLFTGGFLPFDYNLGRSTWKQLMGATGSLQRRCNREGFNNRTSNTHAWARIGIVSNEGGNCSYTDSRIGLGTNGQSCGQNNNISVGNSAKCSTDNRDRQDASFGTLFVR